MKVSIIVPAYNAEEYLNRALDSIVNQVYKNIEIIVIDDCSTDNTKNIIKEYADSDDRIIPFYLVENKGVSAARNIGLKAATGDYIVFVDSDDEITKDAVRRMVDVAEKYNSDYVDSYHLLRYTKDNGKQVSFTENKIPKKTLCLGKVEDDIRVISMYNYTTGKLIKRQLLEDIKFDENLRRYEDLVLDHQLKIKLKNYTFLNKPIYIYYQREDSLVNIFGKKHLCYLDAARIVKDLYKDYDDDIKNTVHAVLFQNMVLTLFTKVIKNDDSNEENAKLVREYLLKLIDLFPNYEQNSKLNIFIRRKIKKLLNDDKKLLKYVSKLRKKDFVKLYFSFLSVFRKYEIKSTLI